MESQYIEQGNYLIKEQIGTGGFSEVFSALHQPTGVEVAIKAVNKAKMPVDVYERELRLIKMTDHPFCTSFYESFEDDNYWYLVMEKIDNGTLLQQINKSFGVPEWKAQQVFCQLICCLDYLHNELHLIHRDLKAENIMFDRNNNIRLIDFGLSNTLDKENLLKTACGSPAYAPPEMLTGELYNESVDIWSCGIVLYAMITGKLPFQDANIQRLAQKIVYTDPVYPPSVSSDLQDLLSRLLEKDPKNRITIPEIYQHPWFKKYPQADKMRLEFGVDQGWRTVNGTGYILLDPRIIQEMQRRQISLDNLTEDINNGVFSAVAASYRILKRELVISEMSNFAEPATDMQASRPRINMCMSVPHNASVPRKRICMIQQPQTPSSHINRFQAPHQTPAYMRQSNMRGSLNARKSSSIVELPIDEDGSLEELKKQYYQLTNQSPQIQSQPQPQQQQPQFHHNIRMIGSIGRAGSLGRQKLMLPPMEPL